MLRTSQRTGHSRARHARYESSGWQGRRRAGLGDTHPLGAEHRAGGVTGLRRRCRQRQERRRGVRCGANTRQSCKQAVIGCVRTVMMSRPCGVMCAVLVSNGVQQLAREAVRADFHRKSTGGRRHEADGNQRTDRERQQQQADDAATRTWSEDSGSDHGEARDF